MAAATATNILGVEEAMAPCLWLGYLAINDGESLESTLNSLQKFLQRTLLLPVAFGRSDIHTFILD